jgi:hypothetical protein
MGLLLLYNFYYIESYMEKMLLQHFLLLFVSDNKESNNKEKETV